MDQSARIAELEAQLKAEQEKNARLEANKELPKPGTGFTAVSRKSDNPDAPKRWGQITTPEGKTYRLSIWQYVTGNNNIRESITVEHLDRNAKNSDGVAQATAGLVGELMTEEKNQSMTFGMM